MEIFDKKLVVSSLEYYEKFNFHILGTLVEDKIISNMEKSHVITLFLNPTFVPFSHWQLKKTMFGNIQDN